MSKLSVKGRIMKDMSNIPGWRTRRHLVILETDDWGSIRMPSEGVFENLLKESRTTSWPASMRTSEILAIKLT